MHPTQLVALNHERAEEEKRGLIRWLRPEFQQARAGGAAATTGEDETEEAGDDETPAKKQKAKTGGRRSPAAGAAKAKPKKSPKRKWPKTMAEQAKAVREALTTDGPGTAQEITKRFSRAKEEKVTEILDTLATLGQARRDRETYRGS